MIERLINILTYNPKSPLIFSSGLFLYLFFGVAFVYMLLQRRSNLRILFVTLFSYYFYYKSSGHYFLLLALVTTTDYFIAETIGRMKERGDDNVRWRKMLLVLSLCIDLGLLFYFKYTNFFAGMLSAMIGNNFQPWDIFLPVGISFFTFQSMSYVIDVYRGDIRPLGSLMDYAFYVSFFPQLVAGPIVRATDFAPQIRKPVVITREMFAQGVYFIMIGLFKKAVISDYISLNFVDRIFDNPTLYSGFENLLGIYGYAMQIYCDFSGYSDMAIGIALLLGFRFPMNFNAPYKSDSITDFWRRWHISLSTWIRDYIYISLGGNRQGKVRQYINLIITMLLGGLWLFFRSATFAGVGTMLSQIFTNFHAELIPQVLAGYKYVLCFMAFGYVTHFVPDSWQNGAVKLLGKCNIVVPAVLLTLIVYIVIQVKSSNIQPFIYFQF